MFFDIESQNAQVKLVTSQKLLRTLFKISFGQKMLRFWKVILENLKNWETFGYFSDLKFSRVFVMKFDSK